MTVLTEKEQAFVGSIGITGMSTHGACLAGIVRVYLDCHRTMQESLVGDHALQLGKGPLGIGRIDTPLLLVCFLASLARGALADICQIFQADEAVGVSGHDAFRDDMIGVLLQPSLSSTNHHQTAGSRTSAFLLQTLSQSRIMICLGNNGFPCMEGAIPFRGRGDGQVAYAYIHTCHTAMGLRCRGSQQFELGGNDRFHMFYCINISTACQEEKQVKDFT